MTRRKLISIITPCYNEKENVQKCCEAVRDIFRGELFNYDYEHIFCDNASTDGTIQELRNIASDSRIKVILNSRNFGSACSSFNGFLAASGDAALLFLAADLQDPPEIIPQFIKKWEEGYKIVYGIRKKREESWIMHSIRKLYYRLINRLSFVYLPLDVGEFQLVDKAAMKALATYDDYYPYVRGMLASCGFDSIGIEYTWKRRQYGSSKNHLYDLVDQGINGIVSFSKIPMRLCMFCGFFLFFATSLYALVTLVGTFVRQVVYGESVASPGIPTLIVATFFFSGIQLFFLGVLGEYVCAIHSQVRKGPLVIERERINF